MLSSQEPRLSIAPDFSITIDFQKGQGSPSRVFRAMSELIDAFQKIDETLISSIDSKIEPLIFLEDVEIGSLKTWLRQALGSIDDDALHELEWKKAIGAYLVKGKYLLINYIDKTTTVTDGNLQMLEGDLNRLALETHVSDLDVYHPIRRRALLEDIARINRALDPLEEGDHASFSSDSGTATFNLEFSITPETIDELSISEVQDNFATMILKVKKPDFTGDSMWQFHYDKRTIDVKIGDERWLKSFQDGNIPLAPGDAIRARVAIRVEYDTDRNVMDTHYAIITVEEVMPKPRAIQGRMFDETPQLPEVGPGDGWIEM